jgi:DNA-binding ferritin-like protein
MKKGKRNNKTKSVKRGSIKGGKNKSLKANKKTKTQIVPFFLEMLNVIKLFHWNTHSYPEHKATDELYERLGEHIDKFVEVLLGKENTRIHQIEKHIRLYDFKTTADFKDRVFLYRQWLSDLDRLFSDKKDADLLNIRDEMVADINQFLYLLSLDK